jgi:hypothetical protein
MMGHTVGAWQSQDLNPGLLPAKLFSLVGSRQRLTWYTKKRIEEPTFEQDSKDLGVPGFAGPYGMGGEQRNKTD